MGQVIPLAERRGILPSIAVRCTQRLSLFTPRTPYSLTENFVRLLQRTARKQNLPRGVIRPSDQDHGSIRAGSELFPPGIERMSYN
jgi:hypothetical protein